MTALILKETLFRKHAGLFGILSAALLTASEEFHDDDKFANGGDKSMKSLFVRLWKGEEGQDLVEYGLLLGFIAVIAIATIKGIGTAISTIFTNASSSLTSS